MKVLKLIVLMVACVILQSASCKKDKLPDISENGQRTFGCLVNGEIFVPNGPAIIGPDLSAAYYFSNNKYHFRLDASGRHKKGYIERIFFLCDNVQLKDGQTYPLQQTNDSSGINATYTIISGGTPTVYHVKAHLIGELSISKLDTVNKIISGTFLFDAENNIGNKVEIRDGRFDVKY